VNLPRERSKVLPLAEQVLAKPQIRAHPAGTTDAVQARAVPAPKSVRVPARLVTLAFLIITVVAMAVAYVRSGEAVTLKVNGDSWQTRTHQQTVGAFLREAGLALRSEDIVLPQLDTLVTEGQTVVVQRALAVLVEADGQVSQHYTHSSMVADLLREAGVNPQPHDVVMLNQEPVSLSTPLPRGEWRPSRWPLLQRSLARTSSSEPAWIQLQRAIPLSVDDGGTQTTIYTVARTVGEALLRQDIVLYLGDQVQPLLGTLLTAGMHVDIHRATPVAVQVDGEIIKTRTRSSDVAQLLSEVGVQLSGLDYVMPSLATEIVANMPVRVVRVVEDWVVESKEISYATVWRGDSTLELDQSRLVQSGKVGVHKQRVHLVYEDGQQIVRELAEEWTESQPVNRIFSYGTKIVVRELETPDGVIRYWRKIRMLATSYTAATSGKTRDHPEYGITRLGWRARKGLIAVDPLVIRLRTNMYVPGYGFGIAADTGGMIKGRWIDLCYDEDNLILWKKWVDVYLLEPVPASKDVAWTLPSYPTERR